MTTTQHDRLAIVSMYAGLGLTVIATIVPYVDQAGVNGLAGHIRAGYPAYSQVRIDAATRIYLIYLSIVGALGIVCWLGTIWAIRSGKPWIRWVATTIFVTATIVAITDLLVKDTSGDTGLPSLLSWIGILPCLAGLLSVALLWGRPSHWLTRTKQEAFTFFVLRCRTQRTEPQIHQMEGEQHASTDG